MLGDELGSLELGAVGNIARDVSTLAGDVIIVYSVATGRIRRFMSSNRSGELSKVAIADGEAFMKIAPQSGGFDLDSLQGMVNVQTGKTPADDRYVVIDSVGNIVGAILADPLCGDSLPGCSLIAHALADGAWAYDKLTGIFTPPPPPPPKV